MSSKSEIILMYYEEKLNIIQIANKLNVSKQYVSKIVRKDDRHSLEKEERKHQSIIRRKQQKSLDKKKSNEKRKADNSYEQLMCQHNQASAELSKGRTISNRAFKKWNSSAYIFRSRTREYRIQEDYKNKMSYAAPKKIKWY